MPEVLILNATVVMKALRFDKAPIVKKLVEKEYQLFQKLSFYSSILQMQ